MFTKNGALPVTRIMVGEWLKKYGDRLHAYAKKRLSSDEEIEDAIQETLLAAIESADRFRGDSSESTWLIGILRHKIHDIYRIHARDSRFFVEQGDDIRDEFAAPGRDHRPDSAVENKELHTEIMDCIHLLPQSQATAFVLRELDHLTTPEICKILSVTPTNLNVILFRARVRLKECLSAKGVRDV